MKIDTMSILNFKTLRKTDLKFSNGVTVIKGPNEAGKSTLLQAIIVLLFLAPASATSDSLKSWGCEARPRLSAHFFLDGMGYTLEKDFSQKLCLLRSDDGSFNEVDREKIKKFVESALGCPGEKFFLSTACIRHGEIEELKSSEIGKLLERRVLAGPDGATFEAVIKDLTKEIAHLKKGTERVATEGPIKDLEDELNILRETRVDKETRISKLSEARHRVAFLKSEIQQLEEELEAAKLLSLLNEKLIQVSNELERDEQQYEKYLRISQIAEDLRGIDSMIKSKKEFRDQEVEVIYHAEEDLRNKRNLTKSLAEKMPTAGTSGLNFATPAIAIATIILAALAYSLWKPPLIYLSAAAIGVLLILIILGNKLFKKDVASALSDKIADSKKEESEAASKLEVMLKKIGYINFDSFVKDRDEYFATLSKKNESALTLNALLSGTTIEEADRAKRKLATEIQRKKDFIVENSAKKMQPVELEKLRLRIDEAKTQLLKKKNELAGNEMLLRSSDDNAEDLCAIDEKITQIETRLSNLRYRLTVLETIRDAMETASKKIRSSMTSLLERSMGVNISRITSDRYDKVKIDPRDLKFSAFSTEKGGFVDVDEDLSTATREQFYLCARLGIVEHLTGGKKPPLIFDDPIQYFDRERMERALSILRERSKDQQVIIFSHRDELDGFADGVISLKEE